MNSLPETGVLYHVSLSKNTISLYENGVDPAYSTGKLDVSWYVNRLNIEWAILHVSLRHGVPVGEIAVCAVLVVWRDMRKTAHLGRYYTTKTFMVESITPAEWFIGEEI